MIFARKRRNKNKLLLFFYTAGHLHVGPADSGPHRTARQGQGNEEDDDSDCVGRAAHQAPEVDGECVIERGSGLRPGELVRAVVVGTEGADLLVSPRERIERSALAPAAAVSRG